MQDLIAAQLQNDPRLAQAKRLVLEALADHQRDLSGVRPPIAELAIAYDQLVKDFSELRGGSLYYPISARASAAAAVELADGSVKYDLISGIGVHGFGHCHPLLVGASFDAAVQDTVMQGNLQQNGESADVSRLLLEAATRGFVEDQPRLSSPPAARWRTRTR